jgi:hypothetical protein
LATDELCIIEIIGGVAIICLEKIISRQSSRSRKCNKIRVAIYFVDDSKK